MLSGNLLHFISIVFLRVLEGALELSNQLLVLLQLFLLLNLSLTLEISKIFLYLFELELCLTQLHTQLFEVLLVGISMGWFGRRLWV